MKIIIESTTRTVFVKPSLHSASSANIECRVWEGATDSGIKVQCLIPRIAVASGQDLTQFEAELKEHRAPADVDAFPLRMIL
jgi:hypothetical protein